MSGSADRPSAEDRARILQPVPLGDLRDAAFKPPRFVVDPILPRGVATLMGAHGGAGKSTLALVIAAHVATGRTWAGYAIDQGRVLFASLEDGPEIVRYRLLRICNTYNLDPETVARNVSLLDGTRDDCPLANEISMDGIRTLAMAPAWLEIEEAAPGHDLVIADNASDAFAGDENSRRQVRQFVRALTMLARENDAAMLLLCHIDKASARFGTHGNSYSGSTAWHNSARSRLAMIPTSDGGVELTHEKSNFAKIAPPLRLDWSPEYGVLVPTTVNEADRIDQDAQDCTQVLNSIRVAIESGADVPTARTGPVTTFAVLRRHRGFPEWAARAGGKDRFWAALNQLLAQKAIEVAEHRNQDSKLRKRYEIRQSVSPLNPLTPVPGTGGTGGADSPIPPIPPITRTGGTGGTGGSDQAAAYLRAKDGDQ